MGKKDKVKRGIASALALPKEIVLNLPMISILGNEELAIENFKGVVEYTDDAIRISTSKGLVRIEGRKLLLKQVTSEIISITGALSKIEFLG
ncbi:MAG: sporulation protein YqfC [Clostridiales bacterium]|jgi:sporulation protein YqfC|nr:sporulation protein YqfC [Clostridiales bacterium]